MKHLFFSFVTMLLFSIAAVAQTDITNGTGTVSAQYTDSPAGEDIAKVIDNLSGTKYLTFHNAGWIQFQASASHIVTRYAITSANDAPERDPLNWTFQGSTNGTTWTTLDTRNNEDFATRLLRREFTFTNTTAYTHYRLNLTNNSGTVLQLAEWEIFGSPVSGVVTAYQHTNYTGTSGAFAVGSYTTAQMQANGVPDNSISSVRVTAGYQVTFYDGNNFTGATFVRTADDATLVGDGWNDRASSMVVSPVGTAPAAPTSLTATAVSSSQINLSWTDNANNETLFRIERSTNGTTFTSLTTVGANVTSYSNTGLTASTAYYYRVRAENASGNSSYSNTANATTQGVGNVATVYQHCDFTGYSASLTVGDYTLEQLAGLGVTNNDLSSIKVTSGYMVTLYDDNNFSGASVTIALDETCLTAVSFNDRAASVRVRVYDPGTTAPVQPSYVRALGISGSQIDISWIDNSVNESLFRIERSTDGVNFTSIATASANATTYSNTGLAAGTKYYYRVRAENANGNSQYGNLTGAHTRETPPASIVDYVANGGHNTETMFLISYNDHVAFYGDQDFLNTNRAQVAAWIDPFVTSNWQYIKTNYGTFGANRLNCFMHYNKFGGGTIASMFDTYSNGRNTIDVGATDWSESNFTLHEVLTHEMGHLIEGSSHNIHESPFFALWGDSKWNEIHVYDLFFRTGLADAQRSYNGFVNQTHNGVFWFRDWFYPLWRDYGQTQVLYNMFHLLALHFPKQLENNTNFIYSRRANMGEFFYFMSGATGVNLKARATTVFGWTAATEAEWNQAHIDYPGVTFQGKGASASSLARMASPMPESTIKKESKIAVWPNPSSDFVNVETPDEAGVYHVTIQSVLSGQQVSRTSFKGRLTSLDIKALSPGLYVISITDKKGLVKKEMIRVTK